MSSVRCFIALELPAQAREACWQQIQLIKTNIPRGIRWETAEKIHLTLRFLGDVPDGQIAAVKTILSECAAQVSPFSLEIGQLGVFPRWQAPRVVWLGLDRPGELMTLQRELDHRVNSLGFSPDNKPFSPHLTLGRVDRSLPAEETTALGNRLKEQQLPPLGRVDCDTVTLFQSLLKPGGSVYTPLVRVKLITEV
ncbi:MAG: RNA 2',3'-cyclic phosphodiesterase [Anaerolineae bacterium]|nr:RNA 2',3'-cyclic phosphodiesterase [Anaerolineae bacterium]